VVILSELRLVDNIAISRSGLAREGDHLELVEGPHEAVGETLDPKLLIEFLRNDPVCFALDRELSNAEAAAQYRRGIRYGCVVAVPPIVGVTIGGLFLGWRTQPLPGLQRRAQVIMSDAAISFAVW
jgi:hypothetical protein